MQEVGWVKMKPVNSHGAVVPSTKAYRCRRGHVSIDYPNKKVEYKKLWELAKKAVDVYILAGWQVGKKTGKERVNSMNEIVVAASYAAQRKVLEYLVHNRK